MGKEALCTAHFGDASSEGKALLETDYVLFRGDFRLKLPFADLSEVDAVNGQLRLKFSRGVAALDLGAAAEKWADAIRNPRRRAAKLGLKAGLRVVVENIDDPAFLDELRAARVEFTDERPDVVFLGIAQMDDLGRIHGVQLESKAALWIVYPKGRKELRETEVLSAGRAAGLTDIKVVSFSSTHTALKFVVPVARRGRASGS